MTPYLTTVVQRAARRLLHGPPAALILLYHRIAEPGLDPWQLAVSPRHFAEHMEILRRACSPMSLTHLDPRSAERSLPAARVVVTFDDGYADNYHAAFPLLQRFEIPATIFVATGTVGSGDEYWWDELERLLLSPGRAPGELRIRMPAGELVHDLGAAADYSEADAQRDRYWRAEQPAPTPRHQVYLTLCEQLRGVAPAERQDVLSQVAAWAGSVPPPRASHRSLDTEEIATLAGSGLVDIGAHTVHHPALAARPAGEQQDEVERSRATLEEITGMPIVNFAYPFGGRGLYSTTTARIVRTAGLARACTTTPGTVSRRADPYHLRRVYVHDQDGDAFMALLRRHLGVGHG